MWGTLLAGAAFSVAATVDDPCESASTDFVGQQYVDPRRQDFQQVGPAPDLLLVFMESMDDRLVQSQWMPELSQLRTRGTQYGHLKTLQGANWTMGGIFSALCGLPLQSVGVVGHNAFEYATHFFDGGHCLTDVLAQKGWELSFYGGASLKFAGKGQFLAAHGVKRRFGREEWEARGVSMPAQGWGVLDAELVESAWQDMQRPRKDPATPQASIVLTVNTHGPSGTTDVGCGQSAETALKRDDLYRAALACTDTAVAQLVRRFLQQTNGRPKLVWLMGDHMAPLPLLFDGDLDQAQQRDLFHVLLQAEGDGTIRKPADRPVPERQISHLDLLPTLVQALGLTWGADAYRLGMGVSLLQPDRAQPTLLEREGLDRMNRQLVCPSPRFMELWFARQQPDGFVES
ncbi:LTA synthase family protein [Inhella gelatinilytica]|uniref:LTA synthase family protein n=1 Tax=Inhella gelatinilytica TaxID=2795030 RepID=A0A931IU66_9BURK|nr:LTA synthase family protein [Inhella gelatinilytica]MBH9552027.1 LTA synthase family protein [Inhella gelatinilytica]